jgi:hypothetical protein
VSVDVSVNMDVVWKAVVPSILSSIDVSMSVGVVWKTVAPFYLIKI